MTKKLIFMITIPTITLLQAEVRPYVQLDLDGGTGDTLVSVNFLSGDTEELDAGTGFTVAAGIEFDTSFSMPNLTTQLMVGYKFDSIDGDNGSVDISRLTFSALEVYNFERVSVGAGVTYHVSPSISGDGLLNEFNVDFDSAFGLIGQIGYRFTEQVTVGLKGTLIDYTEPYLRTDIEASSVGFYGSYSF